MRRVASRHAERWAAPLLRLNCALLILVSPSLLHAQASSNTPVDLGVWLGYQGNHAMEKDSLWRLVIAGVAKRNKEIVDAQAYLLKGGIGYELKRDLQVSAGYIIERHIPFDSSSQPYKWTEHRIFEEVQFSISPGSGNKTLKQRVSLEERWLARKSAPDYERVTSYKFETTLKYQLQFVFPLNPKTDSIFYDEVHLRLLPRNEKRLDQNRLFAGLSFKIESKNISRLEVGYMLQTAHNSAETAEGLQRVNHVISVTVISDAPLRFK